MPPSTGAMPPRRRPAVSPSIPRLTPSPHCSVPAGGIRDLGGGHPGSAGALLERRAPAGISLHRVGVRWRRCVRPTAAIAGVGRYRAERQLLQPDPEAPAGFDYVLSESTYGDRVRTAITPQQRRQHSPEKSTMPRKLTAPCLFQHSRSNERRN